AGASQQQNSTKALRASAQNVPFNGDDSTLFLNLGSATTQEPLPAGEEGYKVRFQSYFGRIQYAFDDKYLINATVRRDGASIYSVDGDVRTATFPSVGIGWVLSKESFMQDTGIDFLKLKASWGELGNASIPRQFDAVATVQSPYGSATALQSAISITQLVDTSINWEVVTEYDFGFELKTFRNRFSLEGGYYNRETTDAVFAVNIPSQAGLGTNFTTNAGSFVNKGFELSAAWSDKVGDKWSYSVYGNLTTIDNEITEVLGGSFLNTGPGFAGEPIKRWQKGAEIGAYYGYQVAGVIQNAEESAAFNNAPIGSLRFADLDGNGVIDANDKTFLGSPIPELTYGFGFNVGYSSVDLSVEFQGVAGNEIYNFNRNSRFANENWDQDFVNNHWSPTNPSNSYPAANSDQNASRPSSFYVEKGDYFRIRNIQLGWSLPKSLLEKAKIDNIRLYVSAQNPFTQFNYNGFSPELGSQGISDLGIDNNVYPLSAVYSFGLNLNF
ncbi:MAG: SusC/RagA family TonB-linked outer membrane protein, partial [Proteobacteria bacterium]